MGRVVRQYFHKALSLKGLWELCKYLILNRLRPHNKTEEEKNQEKKKKNQLATAAWKRRQGRWQAAQRSEATAEAQQRPKGLTLLTLECLP